MGFETHRITIKIVDSHGPNQLVTSIVATEDNLWSSDTATCNYLSNEGHQILDMSDCSSEGISIPIQNLNLKLV